jgi:hypothetical protein
MAPFETFNVGITGVNVSDSVIIESNSSIEDFTFNPLPLLSFTVTGADGTVGFCRVAIPLILVWPNAQWTVTVNGTVIPNRTVVSDAHRTYIYFTYHQSTETVQMTIPEFPSLLILPLFMIATLLVVIVFRRRRTSMDAKCWRAISSCSPDPRSFPI